MNSRAEQRTNFCENSDPILARIAAGSCGSAPEPSATIPVTPVASAVRIIVPRLPGESIDSTPSHRALESGRKAANEVHRCRTTAPRPCGSAARVSSRYRFGARRMHGVPAWRSLRASFWPNGLDNTFGATKIDSMERDPRRLERRAGCLQSDRGRYHLGPKESAGTAGRRNLVSCESWIRRLRELLCRHGLRAANRWPRATAPDGAKMRTGALLDPQRNRRFDRGRSPGGNERRNSC